MRIRNYTNKWGEEREEMILNRKEQEDSYIRCICMILNNTRYILDNVEHMPEFKVDWQNYGKKAQNVGKKPKPL